MTDKRSPKAKAETIRRRAIRRDKRQDAPSIASVETWLNMSELKGPG